MPKAIKKSPYLCRFSLAIILLACLSGIAAILLHLFLNLVETLAFGHIESADYILASRVTGLRRFLSLSLSGLIVSVIWYILQKDGRQLISVKGQIKAETAEQKQPRFLDQLVHAFNQILAVGAGAPIGKEVAPREIAALLAGRVSDFFKLKTADRRLLVASSAAAGLAAIYQVPLAGLFFIYELLGIDRTLKNIAISSFMTFGASQLAHLVIKEKSFYHLTGQTTSLETLMLALVLGLLLGPLAAIFATWTKQAEAGKIKDSRILWRLPLTFVVIAGLSIYLPEILGNGRFLAQADFDQISLGYALALLVAKVLAVVMSLKNGAYGGTLTPSFAIGASLGLIFAYLISLIYPDLNLLAASILGAAAFLAVTMKAPLTAIGLTLSFTGQSLSFLLPLVLAVLASHLTYPIFKKK